MKVKYPVGYNYSNSTYKGVELEYSTGEIVGFIQGDEQIPDRFIVCDDKSGAFIKINVGECYKFEEDADS